MLTAIIGPNARGKSTLLRALSRLLHPKKGEMDLESRDIRQYAPKKLATKLALLPQQSVAPFGISVSDLVGRGRFPHQSFLQQWSRADEIAVNAAMERAGVLDLADRSVDELSGGQRQRVWLALVLAQDTPTVLLDEPTTFLDISYQIEVLELCLSLDRTVVVVLHDLTQAARYADHLIVMKDGEIVAEGDPRDILTTELIKHVYNLTSVIMDDPVSGSPMIIPIGTKKPTKNSSSQHPSSQHPSSQHPASTVSELP